MPANNFLKKKSQKVYDSLFCCRDIVLSETIQNPFWNSLFLSEILRRLSICGQKLVIFVEIGLNSLKF